ncbi:unnamed protein product [marine sediment metagenome]|uniref:Uncharacterized protein n=1 Tax=marine sediment metagenome TaxID=412755 RepID=X1HSG5_9ZZZZ
MIYFRGKKYYSPLEASKKFRIALPTVYYWIRIDAFKNHILDLKKFGEEKEIDPKELRAEFYIEEKILKEKARFLNYQPVEIYSKERR